MNDQRENQLRKKKNKEFSKKEIEVLFYFLDNSVLNANLEKAKCFLELLKQAYRENRFFFQNSLTSWQKEELKILEKRVLEKNLLDVIEPVKEYSSIQPTTDAIPEKEIVNRIIKNKSIFKLFSNSLNLKNPKVCGIEIGIDVGNIGKGYVDLILDDIEKPQWDRYIIEFKTHLADHKVVGQIKKYSLFFQKQRIFGLWNKVIPVVVAHGFDKFTITELKKAKVKTLIYESVPENKILFREV